MTISPSTVIIPVKIQVREMDAKLLLSCIAVESGFPVIIGSKVFLHFLVDSIPRGVYLAKSFAPKSIPIFNILRKLGHEIVAWDNDLLRETDPEYYRKRMSPSTIRHVSRLIAWGPDHASVLRNYPGNHDAQIHSAGNARVDLLRPELREFYRAEANAIRKRFGNFVLVSTNFSKVENFSPQRSELKEAMEKEENDAANRFNIEKGRYKLALFNHFQEMLPFLCKSVEGSNVVLRPHPAENPNTWQAIAARCNNLHVASDGNIIPWLMAAQALIANSCTTQVESAVLDRPTVNYQPVKSEVFDFELPCLVSRSVFSLDELCTTVHDIVKGKIGPLDYAERRKVLDRHIASLDGPLASERIIQVLEDEGYNKRQPPAPLLHGYAHGWIHNRARTLIKRINMHRPGNRNHISFHDHLFPGISVSEIRRKIELMGRLLNRFDGIKVTQISKHAFRISR
jgi:hypothetical protein